MKKTTGFSLAVAATLLLSSNAMALPTVAGTATIIDHGHETTGGGEFIIQVTENEKETNYISFCLEEYEYIYYNIPYTIDSLADYAESRTGYGRGADANGKDPLDAKTKWVFWNYIQNKLTYTNDINTQDQQANAVQYAIWVIEEERKYEQLSAIYKNQYDAWFQPNNNYTIDGRVQALNLSPQVSGLA